jgi:DNA polymerase-3 subunit epsilon
MTTKPPTPTERARRLLELKPVFLDTETTGLDEPLACEISVVDTDGTILFDQLCRPARPIEDGAYQVHGISNEMVENAMSFNVLWPVIETAIAGRTVVIYNAAFDLEVIDTSLRSIGTYMAAPIPTCCAMKLYAEYHGEWNDYRRSWRWQKLGDAVRQCNITLPAGLHRALADAEACRRIVHHMAGWSA